MEMSCFITDCNVSAMSFSLPYECFVVEKTLQGAVENLLERCTHIQLLDGSVVLLDDGAKALILSALREMSASALCCLGFAYKDELAEFATYDGEDHAAHKYLLDPSYYSSIESNTIFCGFVGLRVRTFAYLIKIIQMCIFFFLFMIAYTCNTQRHY
jgi:magnesium-transporting ATPase (P-type)